MSYILDALKKSEQERKLGGLPDISSEHQLFSKKSEQSWLLYISVLLLGMLVLIALFFTYSYLYQEKAAKDSVQTNSSPVVKKYSQNAVNNKTEKKSSLNSSLVSNQSSNLLEEQDDYDINSEPEIIRPNRERRENLQEQQKQELEKNKKLKLEYQGIFKDNKIIEESSEEGLGVEESEQNEIDGSEDELLETEEEVIDINWDDYNSIAALDSSLKQQIPSIKVSTHIYSSVESFRKVTINGYSVKSGAEISEGLVVEHILEEGVIFSFKGVYFRMKALEVWQG